MYHIITSSKDIRYYTSLKQYYLGWCDVCKKKVRLLAGLPLGSVFQAMVSVMAVKIQFSSPSGVRRSFSLPGILQLGRRREPQNPSLAYVHMCMVKVVTTAD